MSQHFINRKNELEFLKKSYNSKGPEFIVIYGRRRIGKTELVLKFLKNHPGIYFLATKEGDRENIKNFATETGKYLNDENFSKTSFPDWISIFESLAKNINFAKRQDKTIIIIDEFPFLINSNNAIPSIFQKIWEQTLKKENIMLILLGSSISIMESKVLGYKSPLYGRRTGQWQVEPLEFEFLKDFLPNYSTEDLINTWFAIGGMPAYLLKFDPNASFFENIKNEILKKGSYLNREMDILLNEEFREPKNYKLIFKAISLGCNRLAEICNHTGLDKSMVSKYLDVLEKLNLIEEEKPVISSVKFKRRLYTLFDPYFNFYFRYVYPNKISLEAMRHSEVLKLIREDFQAYSGKMFELLAKQMILTKKVLKDASFEKIGRQWGKTPRSKKGKNTYEIDIVAVNEHAKEILFVECKWKWKANARKILNELKEKAGYVQWSDENRKERYVIFAKSFKEKIKEPNLMLFDLKDLEKVFK